MKIINLIQGTPEWHAHRAQHYNASDAPAMMGCGDKTRTELLHERHMGFTRDVSSYVQEHVFDPGHEFEALARPLAEEILGEDLYPVTGVLGKLSASFDGLTMGRDKPWEHKRLNAELRAAFARIATIAPEHRDSAGGCELPKKHQVQMEQQCMVSGLKRVMFTASEWTEAGELVEALHCWYESNPELAHQIRLGWEQFEIDEANYVPQEVLDKPVARVVTSLPAVSVQVSGALVVRDNFGKFETALRHFIEKDLIVKPETDQDFADLTLQIKALEDAEAALESAETQMLSQVEQVDAIKRTKEMLLKLASTHRIAAKKRLDARKQEIKGEIVADGVTAFREHIEALNKRLGKPYMPVIAADFGGVIKNLRTVESLRNAVNTELARVKILANETADRIDANLKHLRETASEHTALFPDTATIVLKALDDLKALAANRINAHEQAEQKKQDELREKIRKEEADRLQREADEARDAQAQKNAMAMQEIQGIQQQVAIAISGRLGVRKGGTIECIRDTLGETENWPIEESNFGPLTGVAQAANDKAVAEIRQLLANADAKAAITTAAAPVDAPAAERELPTNPIFTGSTKAVASALGAAAPTRVSPALPTDSGARLTLGQINERIAPISITVAGLSELGFDPVEQVKASRFYRESDLGVICEALIQHLTTVADGVVA